VNHREPDDENDGAFHATIGVAPLKRSI